MNRKSEFLYYTFLSFFFLLFLQQCWNDHWNLCLVEQIRASECIQHVITITSTEYDSQISRCRWERSSTEKCQVVILKKKSHMCHAAFWRQGRQGTHSRMDWHFATAWFFVTKNHSGTDGACVRRPWWSSAAGSSPTRAKHRRKGKLV